LPSLSPLAYHHYPCTEADLALLHISPLRNDLILASVAALPTSSSSFETLALTTQPGHTPFPYPHPSKFWYWRSLCAEIVHAQCPYTILTSFSTLLCLAFPLVHLNHQYFDVVLSRLATSYASLVSEFDLRSASLLAGRLSVRKC